MFALLLLMMAVALLGTSIRVAGSGPPNLAGLRLASSLLLSGIIALAFVVPLVAVQVRRFHDQDKSGWFVLLNLIPYIGVLVVLVFMLLDGTAGDNRFGPDPKAGERQPVS